MYNKMFNKMCDLPFARMHAVHLTSLLYIKNGMQYLKNSVRDIIGSVRKHMSQRGSHILLNTVTLKTDPCLVLRCIKMY